MQYVIANILPIFLIILVGKIIKLKWLTAEEFWRGLERLSYFLLFPIVLFNLISKADLSAMHLIRLVLALMGVTTIVSAVLIMVQKRYNFEGNLFTSVFQGGIRYNSYILFGLTRALYGEEGMTIVAVIAAYMIIYTNILTVLIFSWYSHPDPAKQNGFNNSIQISKRQLLLKNVVTNPLIISSLIGFIVNYADINISLVIQKSLTSLSDSALAIGILCIGAGLRLDINQRNFFAIALSSIIKLIGFPILAFIILKVINITGLLKSVGILYCCLPTATNSYLLSRQLGGDSEAMASIITVSTILSVLSLPVLTYILA